MKETHNLYSTGSSSVFVNELRKKKRKSTNCSDLMTQINDLGQAILSIFARKCLYWK